MLMGKVYANALMFGLNGVCCLVQYMSVKIKSAKSCVKAGFGKLSPSTSKLCKLLPLWCKLSVVRKSCYS